MSNRKYESGYQKLQKKKKIEMLIKSQQGTLDKFVINNKKMVHQVHLKNKMYLKMN